MLIENQLVELKWNNNIKKYYEDKGYTYTKTFDPFMVNVNDLKEGSGVNVKVQCDLCGSIVLVQYFSYIEISRKNNGMYFCHDCACKKIAEKKRTSNKHDYYEIYNRWCNNNGYDMLSTNEDCETATNKLFFLCHTHGVGSVTVERIKGGQLSGGCCSSVRIRNALSLRYDEVKEIVESKNNNILLNKEDYINLRTKNLNVVCGSCGKVYTTSLSNIKRGSGMCFTCGRNKENWSSLDDICKNRYEKYLRRCTTLGYEPIMDVCDFKENSKDIKVRFICSDHGEVEQSFLGFLNGKCIFCNNENRARSKRLNTNDVIGIIESKNNNQLLNAGDYKNYTFNNLRIKCGSCGNIFKTSLLSYTKNKDGKCRSCSEISYGEHKISIILDKYCINYKREFWFDDCRDIRPLPFDFYLPDYNMCIEFDGQQHFEPKFGEESFYKTVLHDGMKNNYCKWNNINLVRIDYMHGNNIEEILIKELNLKKDKKNIKIKYIPNRNK